jgi:hypothetical protein
MVKFLVYKDINMKNYLNFEKDVEKLEAEIEKLKDPYNEDGLSEVDTQKNCYYPGRSR